MTRYIAMASGRVIKDSIPENAVITITVNCGSCDFREDAGAGTKPVCSHPRIKCARPYATGENGRAVDRNSMPVWCPLKIQGV